MFSSKKPQKADVSHPATSSKQAHQANPEAVNAEDWNYHDKQMRNAHTVFDQHPVRENYKRWQTAISHAEKYLLQKNANRQKAGTASGLLSSIKKTVSNIHASHHEGSLTLAKNDCAGAEPIMLLNEMIVARNNFVIKKQRAELVAWGKAVENAGQFTEQNPTVVNARGCHQVLDRFSTEMSAYNEALNSFKKSRARKRNFFFCCCQGEKEESQQYHRLQEGEDHNRPNAKSP